MSGTAGETDVRYVLAFDTSTSFIAAAIGRITGDGSGYGQSVEVLASGDTPAHRNSNTRLLTIVDEMLCEAGLEATSLDSIVVGRGPGSFTGVRIAVATAKGLATGLGIPLYGVSTLNAMAWTAWRAGARGGLLVLGDAMRKEVYPALYDLDDAEPYVSRRSGRESVYKVIPVISRYAREDTTMLTVTGDALLKYKGHLEDAGFSLFTDEAAWSPTGRSLLDAYLASPALETSGDPAELLPTYTRLSDAEENERLRLGKGPAVDLITGVADDMADAHLMLRPMSLNDIDQVSALEQLVFTEHFERWSRAMFLDEFRQLDRNWWVAHDRGRIVGFCGGQLIGDDIQILDMGVHPDYRRRGIARRLLERVTYDALMQSARTASLEVRASNIPAIELYTSLGFTVIGERPRYYGGSESALVMEAVLPLKAQLDEKDAEILTFGERRIDAAPACAERDDTAVAAALDPLRPLVLAIETSCDETACSIMTADSTVLAEVVASQIDFHARFGGVVPEIASRKHTETIVDVFREALARAGETLGVGELAPTDMDAFAVTRGPGLVGALVVGVAFGKGISYATGRPLVGVNHLEGHIFANLLEDPDLEPPFITLLVSGGHTMLVHVADWGEYQILGETLDDAVGEAFDKVAKALGRGYPGGPIITELARTGDPDAIRFPRAMLHSKDYRFSLSGLKTAVMTHIAAENAAGRPINQHDLAASFQAAVVDVQVAKAVSAVEEYGVDRFCIGGGVAANPVLREALVAALEPRGITVTLPDPASCTDNATMIARVALEHHAEGDFMNLTSDADPSLPLDIS